MGQVLPTWIHKPASVASEEEKQAFVDLGRDERNLPVLKAALERDLAHPAMAPVAAWFDANIPADVRASLGGTFAA